jgi:hypothetical protein
MGSKADELRTLIEQAKQQLAATEFDMASLSPTTPKWSIPDRRIGMRYLLDVVKGGMDPQHWARLHPSEWARLVQVAPLKRQGARWVRSA